VFTSIPVVSLTGWRGNAEEQRVFAAELVDACHRVGFFLLVDHGINRDLIDRYFAALRSFFALPEETKALMAKRASRHFRGWEAVCAELTNNRVDYREQIDLSSEHPARPADVKQYGVPWCRDRALRASRSAHSRSSRDRVGLCRNLGARRTPGLSIRTGHATGAGGVCCCGRSGVAAGPRIGFAPHSLPAECGGSIGPWRSQHGSTTPYAR